MITLRKGGTLEEKVWNPETRDYDLVDVTDQAIRKLFDMKCDLEDGFLLRDLFLFLNREVQIWDAMFGNHLEEYVKAGLEVPPKPRDVTKYDPDEIEYLELYFISGYNDGKKYGPELNGLFFPELHGVGYELETDREYYKSCTRIPWSVSFDHPANLAQLPLKLNDTLKIYNENYEIRKNPNYGKEIISFDGVNFSLFHIIYGVIWELSYHGGIDSTIAIKKDIDASVEEALALHEKET